ncbi:NADAR domain-containing protein [soil metagenome]
MHQHYNILWLKEQVDSNQPLKYMFFWGHTNKPNEPMGKFVFSQWYESPFVVDNITYTTAEHWMMAQKALLFDDKAVYKEILDCKKPGEAKELGRQVNNFKDDVWNEQRYELVKKGNLYKFTQHPLLRKYLLGTGDRILAEASPIDVIWGIGLSQDSDKINDVHAWRGLNLLGFALMEVRDYLSDKRK